MNKVYYNFYLELEPFDEDVYDELINNFSEAKYALTQLQPSQWLNHEKDFRHFSTKYPGILFTLWGVSNEEDFMEREMWKKYFKEGKMQFSSAKIDFDDFDERRLK